MRTGPFRFASVYLLAHSRAVRVLLLCQVHSTLSPEQGQLPGGRRLGEKPTVSASPSIQARHLQVTAMPVSPGRPVLSSSKADGTAAKPSLTNDSIDANEVHPLSPAQAASINFSTVLAPPSHGGHDVAVEIIGEPPVE